MSEKETRAGDPRPRNRMNIQILIRELEAAGPLADRVAHHEVLPAREAMLRETSRPWPRLVQGVLAARSIPGLYSHQAEACDLVRAGRHVVVATPTASGKTLAYNLPLLETVLADPEARALYLFPLKALAQDQLRTLNELTQILAPDLRPTAAIYDGDTPGHKRGKLRRDPPSVLMTNPEMLHLSMLPHHGSWALLWATLRLVVVDEVHTYRGVFGSHMAQVFRRLRRMARYYGADPAFVFSSATIGNPAELCEKLTGLAPETVLESGAPRGRRHFLFLDPVDSAISATIRILRRALELGLRTIVYTQSRKLTELIALWARDRAGEFTNRISAYRAGFLPEERREIEARMASGELLAVVSTSALELGIDIGELDLCLLVGYPGTVMSTLQRGGRVGRRNQDSAVIMVAGEDALDQHFVNNPRDFFDRPPESAVVNPENPVILARHLPCAAAELTLRLDEPYLAEPGIRREALRLVEGGTLFLSADGRELITPRKRPHREVDLRGAGASLSIEDAATGEVIGQLDTHRATREAHPGAVYLHRGRTWLVDQLDLPGRKALARQARLAYYTKVRASKETEIIEELDRGAARGAVVRLGRLRVTETVTGYEKRRTADGKLLTIVPLELPPTVFETEGLWIEIPRAVQEHCENVRHHFMGGIHAVEHAAIAVLPLLVMCDRNDLGGISTPFHPQVEGPAVFVYDAAPGGVGLSRAAFAKAGELLGATLSAIASCRCELGCPSCVHSPKCGSGNRPISKDAARFVLEAVRDAPPPAVRPMDPTPCAVSSDDATKQDTPGRCAVAGPDPSSLAAALAEPAPASPPAETAPVEAPALRRLPPFCVLDVETRRSAAEVGGWHRCREMGVSVAVLYDSASDDFICYAQEELPALFERVSRAGLVVGFNIRRFDYPVLCGASGLDFGRLGCLDMLDEVRRRLGYRVSLSNLARATLGADKTADGLEALQWWKEGLVQRIADYCQRDVALTRDLYLSGARQGYLLFTNKAGQAVRLPVSW